MTHPDPSDKTSLKTLVQSDQRQFSTLVKGTEASSGRLPVAFFHPRIAPVAWFRVASRLESRGFHAIGALLSLFVQMAFRVEIPSRADIGPGLVLPHPMGIVLGSARIGERVTIFQNVTLGAKEADGAYDLSTRPTIGDDVTIGSGAVVVGPISIGDGATIAANSLVVDDVPTGALAIGVPAAIKMPGNRSQ